MYIKNLRSILIFMSSLSEDNITGMKVVNQYIATAPCNRGGFIGAILYGMFSYLFDKTGAIIAGGFTLFISIALLGSKFYVKHNKKDNFYLLFVLVLNYRFHVF